MADKKITELTALDTALTNDVIPIVDVENDITKKITFGKLKESLAFLGYEQILGGAGSSSAPMTANTSYYFGNFSTQFFPTTSASVNRVFAHKTGTITKISVVFRTGTGTPSSAETIGLYLRLNNTTDYTIDTTTFRTDIANTVYFLTATLSVPISAGGYFNIKMVTPAWSVVANYPYVEVRVYTE